MDLMWLNFGHNLMFEPSFTNIIHYGFNSVKLPIEFDIVMEKGSISITKVKLK